MHRNRTTLLSVLYALFSLASADSKAHVSAVARAAGVSPTLAVRALARLEELGLCDASRVRLTFRGLAVASSYAASVEREMSFSKVA